MLLVSRFAILFSKDSFPREEITNCYNQCDLSQTAILLLPACEKALCLKSLNYPGQVYSFVAHRNIDGIHIDYLKKLIFSHTMLHLLVLCGEKLPNYRLSWSENTSPRCYFAAQQVHPNPSLMVSHNVVVTSLFTG